MLQVTNDMLDALNWFRANDIPSAIDEGFLYIEVNCFEVMVDSSEVSHRAQLWRESVKESNKQDAPVIEEETEFQTVSGIDLKELKEWLSHCYDMRKKDPNWTRVPKMYLNKDRWVTKVSIPLKMGDIVIYLDDRSDVHYITEIQLETEGFTGIDFFLCQAEDEDDSPCLSLYPRVNNSFMHTEELPIGCLEIQE